eukprot:CAMPEP_0119561692 /NCGR_PEP_ID=MMETSP1352-20130426/18357_1 /TAXON_ID=265584 /ORGANISM="Stauroneis constricta, Strain CCMP1120" /LENGTH=429 /DNA_ID=CAMNT_0007609949 /DNA_START=74 /DNA_END=1363 /DNA_ORIENTATION=+
MQDADHQYHYHHRDQHNRKGGLLRGNSHDNNDDAVGSTQHHSLQGTHFRPTKRLKIFESAEATAAATPSLLSLSLSSYSPHAHAAAQPTRRPLRRCAQPCLDLSKIRLDDDDSNSNNEKAELPRSSHDPLKIQPTTVQRNGNSSNNNSSESANPVFSLPREGSLNLNQQQQQATATATADAHYRTIYPASMVSCTYEEQEGLDDSKYWPLFDGFRPDENPPSQLRTAHCSDEDMRDGDSQDEDEEDWYQHDYVDDYDDDDDGDYGYVGSSCYSRSVTEYSGHHHHHQQHYHYHDSMMTKEDESVTYMLEEHRDGHQQAQPGGSQDVPMAIPTGHTHSKPIAIKRTKEMERWEEEEAMQRANERVCNYTVWSMYHRIMSHRMRHGITPRLSSPSEREHPDMIPDDERDTSRPAHLACFFEDDEAIFDLDL